MRRFTWLFFFACLLAPLSGQTKVVFTARDGLSVTADLYLKDPQQPFILLFHQANCSRGEFLEIAPKLLNLNYNCLSVDLRSGGKANFVENETALQANREKRPHGMLDALPDIQAAIHYAGTFNNQPVVLFGSSFSASLSLLIAKNNPMVKAVIAFSPGEYFRPAVSVEESLRGFDKKLFVAVDPAEKEYLQQLLSGVPESDRTLFIPLRSRGYRGVRALWDSSEGNNEYWLALFLFFKELKGLNPDTANSTL